MTDIKRRADLASYHPFIQQFAAALNAKLATCPVTGLRFELDTSSSYPECSATLTLWSATFGDSTDMLSVELRVRSQCELVVDYRSAEVRCNSSRDIRVKGTEAEQVSKLIKRAVARYHEAVEAKAKRVARETASEIRKQQWYADFTGPDGKRLIPLDFAYAYKTPGEYSLDSRESEALSCTRWRKDEVLKLTAVLAEVRAAMAPR